MRGHVPGDAASPPGGCAVRIAVGGIGNPGFGAASHDTPETAIDKAYTALTFKLDTPSLARATQAGEASGVRHLPRIVAVGGGRPIESAGSVVGAIGVSGAPGGEADDVCARVGLAALRDDLEL